VKTWPARPILYEIPAWIWLDDLSRRYGRDITLAGLPQNVWDDLGDLGVDAVWLMGVWERSPAGTAIASENKELIEEFYRTLPDFSPADNVGSPYCVRRYVVDPHLGGSDGLAVARAELARRGIRLVLDFIPNHVAPDHPWVTGHPEYFITGDEHDLQQDPSAFLMAGERIVARGRDPFYPAWPDVLQLNAFHPGLRRAAGETLARMAGQCDGVRCDMAMLVMNDVFDGTWGVRAGPRPATEFWPEIIQAVRRVHPGFLFLAEAYWERERELQQQGFDFCYDKGLYDCLVHEKAGAVRQHLGADPPFQERLVRFIENHDECRAATVFPPEKERAAAVAMATLPGARLFHEGQMEGRKVRLPVFLARRPWETADEDLRDFYGRLLRMVNRPGLRDAAWQLCECRGWPDNGSHENLLAWQLTCPEERYLVVINYSAAAAQGRVRMNGEAWAGSAWRLTDLLRDDVYERSGDEMVREGLYVGLGPWGYHTFLLSPYAYDPSSR